MTTELVVGADSGGTQVKYVIRTVAGQTVCEGQVDTNPHDPQETLTRLAAAVGEGLPAGGRLRGVGLACAGIVSPDGHLGRSPNLPGWEGAALAISLRAAFGEVAAAFANDVNAALYGEWRLGAGRGCSDLIMIALGTGVGGGVVVADNLVTGSHHGAGEIGHMMLAEDGPDCTCGNRGCLEAYAGGWALLARARELGVAETVSGEFRRLVQTEPGRLSTEALYQLACREDRTAVSLFAAAGKRLGQAVANLINVLDPDRVIIGGGVAQAGDLILAPCREVVAGSVLATASRETPVVPAALGPFAAALGAAAMVSREEA